MPNLTQDEMIWLALTVLGGLFFLNLLISVLLGWCVGQLKSQQDQDWLETSYTITDEIDWIHERINDLRGWKRIKPVTKAGLHPVSGPRNGSGPLTINEIREMNKADGSKE